MGAFEHVILLLSFVYALAIAHLLITVAALIRASARVRFSWLHGYWMANALMVLVMDWISFWDVHALSTWNIGTIFVLVMVAFIDYLQAALVCPEVPREGAIDLQRFHQEQSQRYIGAFACTSAMALIANTVVGGKYNVGDWIQQNYAAFPFLAIALVATFVRARWVQVTAPFLVAAIWIYYVVELQGALH